MPNKNYYGRSKSTEDEQMKIILEHNDIYVPGQFIRGNVVFTTPSDIDFADCSVTLMSVAEVGWTDNPGIKDEGRSFHSKHKLLEMSYLLESGGENYFRIGNHEFPFEFFLPEK